MSAKNKKKALPAAPFSLYLICLWAVIRAALPYRSLIGQYELSQSLGASTASSFLGWLFSPNWMALITVLLSLAFIVLGAGVALRQKWSRLGFLILSALVFLWNLRTLSWGAYQTPIYSLGALGISYWLFRQPGILRYFGAKDPSPALVQRKILNLPLDLVVSIAVLAVAVVLDWVSLSQYL